MNKLKRLWLSLASSFTINFILFIFSIAILFVVKNLIVWKALTMYFCISLLFVNANRFKRK